ncbi:MAG: lysoplasmalogenase family protein [Promethearchaeota archaeon]
MTLRFFAALRYLLVIFIIALTALLIFAEGLIPYNFLITSIAISILAFVNLLDAYAARDGRWFRFSLLLLVAMICGTTGDFLMAGVFYITPEPVINGIIMFGLGHLFYLQGLREKSPLLLNSKESATIAGGRVIIRNLLIWLVFIVGVLVVFYLTVFNPANLAMGIAALLYGVLLVTLLAFASTKWFDEFTIWFKLALPIGFFFFLFSDWILAVRFFIDPSFLTGTMVGVTYIIGQTLIHLAAPGEKAFKTK